jgi:hypothetical protein
LWVGVTFLALETTKPLLTIYLRYQRVSDGFLA